MDGVVFKGDDALSMDKAVIFIVEGATDKRALENIFKKIYRYKDIHFEFTHGDITSDENIDKGNVEEEIYKFVDKYRKDKKLKLSDPTATLAMMLFHTPVTSAAPIKVSARAKNVPITFEEKDMKSRCMNE